MCRFVPIAPSSTYLTTLRCLAGGFSPPSPLLVPLQTSLPRRAAPVHRHPASLQLSIHHLPVRRVDCQLGCPDVWQKRHARTLSVPPNSALACLAVPVCASGAPLYAAIAAFSPRDWTAVRPGCTPVLFRAHDAAVLAPPRPLTTDHRQRSPFRLTAPKTIPPEVRSARISTAEWPEPPRQRKLQSFGLCRRYKSSAGTQDTA